MKKTLLLCMLAGWAFTLTAQDIPFIKADQLTAWKNSESDTVFVLNFWATWCAPCVAELPEFERLTQAYADQKVKVILVNADFRSDVYTKLRSFLERKQLQSQVVYIDERTPNKWIDLVSPEWSGAIPATLVVRKSHDFEQFFEKRLHYDDLEKAVKAALEKS
ncbi:MAG: TlpA family protein disulfide reductase [Bacteroidetes bacterium]|nr:MAG: TlpA family protein disulfide reductase [Bacteroidota bacterium]